MFRRSRFTAFALAAVLATTLAFSGAETAIAKVIVHPTVTIHATLRHESVAVFGVYNRKSHRCRGNAGRGVVITFNGVFRARTVTTAGGLYSRKLFAQSGRHIVLQTRVPGDVRGGYGATTICLDAVSRRLPVVIPS